MKTAEKSIIALILVGAGTAYYLSTRKPSPADNPDVATGLASIYDKVLQVATFKAGEGVDGWTIYIPALVATHPEWNTLTTLYKGRAYRIEVSESCTLRYGKQIYPLNEGWNSFFWMGF